MTEGRDFYRGLIKGYEEGLNRAWDDLIGLTTKGYSSREIQVMARSKRQSISSILKERKLRIRKEAGVDLIGQPATATSEVIAGRSYLIESAGLGKAVRVFSDLLSAGSKGLLISHRYPGDLEDELGGKAEMYWLTRQEGGRQIPYPCLSPSEQGPLISTISRFMKDGEGVVMLEGIDYMVLQAPEFSSVAKLLHGLIDQAVTSKSVLLLPINPTSIEERQLHMLENMAYVLSA